MARLLEVEGLKKHYPVAAGGLLRRRYNLLKAADGISFSIEKGTCFGLAGESGSGKTTVGRLVLLMEEPTSGSIRFEGREIAGFTLKEVMWYRTRVQPVFQDAASSLDPRMRIVDIVSEPLEIQRKELSKAEIRAKATGILRLVGLGPESLRKFPHELSGGQKQRVAIAHAMILDPSLVILDEPVSALDVSIRAQILNLLADIQAELHLTYLMVAHDLAMLRQVTTRIAVMYLGKIMELGETDQVFGNPLHPYTRALLDAVPRRTPGRQKEQAAVTGEIGNPLDPPRGCRFAPRCRQRMVECDEVEPAVRRITADHHVACHLTG